MNKMARRFILTVVGCSLVIGSASYAGNTTADSMNSATKKSNDTSYEMTDSDFSEFEDGAFDDDFEGEGFDDFPETGKEFVKEMMTYYNLTDDEAAKLEKLFDEAEKIEGDSDEDFKKYDEKWVAIDEVLSKYEKDELMQEEIPTFENFVKEYELDQDKLTEKLTKELEDKYEILGKMKDKNDKDGLYDAYYDLVDFLFDNELLSDFEDEDYDFDEEFSDDDYYEMLANESFEDLMEMVPVKISDEDTKVLKSAHKDLQSAAKDKDEKALEAAFEVIDTVLEKYEDEIEKYYESEGFDFDEDIEDEESND